MLAIGLLADDAPRNTGPDFGKASPFGLVIVVLLLIGTFLLVWSMNRHLRKLPESFDHPEPDQADDEETVDAERDNGSPPREPGG
jgi:F0F1-type ATP synthase assembly protein I